MYVSSITGWRWLLSIAALALCLTATFKPSMFTTLAQFELALYDWRITLFNPTEAKNQTHVVIVDIDERSLEQEGQWPWPRQRIAQLIDTLGHHYQASIIGLDILFPEPGRLNQDDKLQQALRHNNVLLAELFQLEPDSRPLKAGQLSPAPLAPSETTQLIHQLPQAYGYIGNTQQLAQSAPAGHIAINIDPDGKVRRLPPVVNWQSQQHYNLALQLLIELFKLPPPTIYGQDDSLLSKLTLSAPPFEVPLNSRGEMLIPFKGPAGQYPYIPATDVLTKNVDINIIRDRIVLLGSSATGLFDLIATPWSKSYPGIEVHATLLDGLLNNQLLFEPQSAPILIAILCVLIFTAVMYSYSKPNLWLAFGLPLILAAMWLILNTWLWHTKYIALPLASPLLLAVLLMFINSPTLAIQAKQQRQQLYRYLQDYVPRTVVERLLHSSGQRPIRPERRDMTVMFMDIRGFTSIAEALTPDQLADLMNQVLSPVTRIIHEHEGTIDKYMGDAVMAFWGAPLNQPDHAVQAAHAALEIQCALKKLNIQLAEQKLPTIRAGIGINSGSMTVGNMGSDFRMSYTVIGDAVNIAARLEGLTKEFNADILLGHNTVQAIGTQLHFEYLGPATLRGRKNPIYVYALFQHTDINSGT